MSKTGVLIVGAGPTGLVLALWLTKQGIPVRIIDKATKLATSTRALAVQARVLELYSQIGLGEAVASRCVKVTGPNIWINGTRRAQLPFADAAVGLTAYPFVGIFPQNDHEKLLLERLEQFGVSVELGTGLDTFSEDADTGSVHTVLKKADGSMEKCEARYIAGCDGAHSAVRHGLGVGFPGGTYEQTFYVADIEATGPAVDRQLHLCLDTSDFLGVFPLPGEGRARLIGVVSPEAGAKQSEQRQLTFEDVRGRAVDEMKLANIKVNWFATYHSHHRVADCFRQGRAFLLGDAAHIHSPAGGQGMNTGIGDAINLSWKIASVLNNKAQDSLLDTYEEERIRFARALVKTTDRTFSFMTKKGYLANFVRSMFVRFVAPVVFSFRALRRKAFRTLSQMILNYTGTALADDGAKSGSVLAGERLPWVEVNGENNYGSLAEIEWQLHVYGKPCEQLAAWSKDHDIRLSVFAWAAEHGAAGLAKDAVYLLRPDTYVALVDAKADPTIIERYFSQRQITIC